ncbi:MAG: CoA-acylating methylmalonate-semialdehyde dehydrogenase [bacterium]|nr:CoA-acylating methylmalonate-semialdehyde dehydrogenase [bacterium]
MSTTAELRTITHWIAGKPVEGESKRFGDVYDPALGSVAARVPFASPDEVDRAVAAAKAAFPAWSQSSLAKRTEILYAFRDGLKRRAEAFAALVASEHGKPPSDAGGEIARGLEVVELACSVPLMLKGEFTEQVSRNVDVHSVRQPLGVCVGITPFNFPAMVPLWMFPVALACGNTFVLKPSERDPSASILLAQVLQEAGLPDGVFNVVQGDKVAVDALIDHPDVAAVSFVGSTPIARYIYARGAAAGKRTQALGGAKNHLVAMPDADLGAVADALISSAFGSTGQRCMAISAAVAVGEIADRLIPALRERMAKLHVGPASDPKAELGPLVSRAAQERVVGLIEQGVREGATLAVDGRTLRIAGYEQGFFVGPTLFDHVKPEMEIYRQEIFGPVLVVLRVDSLDEALALLERNPYGNGASIFTSDGAVARYFERNASAGMVGINVPIPVPVGSYSFGGWKGSLFGDQHIYGPEGYRFYTRAKVVTSRWSEIDHPGINLRFPGGHT